MSNCLFTNRNRAAVFVSTVGTLLLLGGLAFSQEASPKPVRTPGVTFSGTVTDAEGRVVPDAQIRLVNFSPAGDVDVLKSSSDANGKWSIKLDQEPKTDIAVIAIKKGHAIGVGKKDINPWFNSDELLKKGDIVDLPIQLEKPDIRRLRVVDERGAPVGKVQVGVNGLWKGGVSSYFTWTDAHLSELTRETDADGVVEFDFLPGKLMIGLLARTPQHGNQFFGVDFDKVAADAVVSLLPVGKVDVSLVAGDATPVHDRVITIDAQPPQIETAKTDQPLQKVRPWGGQTKVRSDKSGKASAVVLAGTLSVNVLHTASDRSFAEQSRGTRAVAGETTNLVIHFKPGVKIIGKVQSSKNEPVANVSIRTANGEFRSDQSGKVVGWIPAGQQFYCQIGDIPAGFALPYEPRIYLPELAPGDAAAANERELPPIILHQAAPLTGQVVDESGKPAPGARVTASWVQQHDSQGYFTLKTDAAISDDAGRFTLNRVFPNVDVIVTAQTSDRGVHEAVTVHSSKPQELQLAISSSGMISIVGSIQGPGRGEFSNATVKVVRALLAPGGHNFGTRPVEWNGSSQFGVEPDGSFISTGKVPRFGKYSLTISVPGYLAVETPFLSPSKTDADWRLDPFKLIKARTASGFVLDSTGRPMPDAEVWSWAAPADGGRSNSPRTTAKTDQAGRWKLENLHPAAALAFVHKDGYRFAGCALLKDVADVTVILFAKDEANPNVNWIQPVNLDDTRRFAAAGTMLNAVIEDQRNSNYFHREIVSFLARANPEAAQAELAKTKSADTRSRILAQLNEIDDALAEAESVTDAYSRAYCRFAVIDAIKDPQQIRDVLSAALLDAQSIVKPDHRIVVVANIVERFSLLGDHERVATLLRDELPRAKALSTSQWPGFARGYFAAQLARTDPETALLMASEATEEDRTRHYLNIAHVTGATNPDVAEEALRRIGSHRYIDDPAVRVAYRMAQVDVPRAIRLLERIDIQQRPVEKARGLAVIASAIQEKDPSHARELLARAFASLPEQLGGAGSRSDEIFGAAMEMVRYAEQIDPDRLTEYFWKAASFHPGPTGGAWSPDDADRSDAERQARLASLFLLYDAAPKLPDQIMESVFQHWETQVGVSSNRFTDHEGTFIAMALTNPERAADWAVRFHQKLETEKRRYIPQPWEVIARTLTSDRDSVGKYITREVYHRWVIDQYDL